MLASLNESIGMKSILMAVFLLVGLTACSPSTEEIDKFQVIAQANAEHNLSNFVADLNFKVKDYKIQTDNDIDASCPSGDGWATGLVEPLDGSDAREVKCQTTGSGKGLKGCLWTEDYNTKSYEADVGDCDKSLGKIRPLKK